MTEHSVAVGAMQLLAELRAHDSWSRERLLEHQESALREIVRHAAESSPYYREALPPEARRGVFQLEDLPTISKSILMREWDRIVTDPRLRLADAEAHLALARPGAHDLHLNEYRILATGGSTGQRGIFAYGKAEFDTCLAGMLRALAITGVAAETRLASIGSPSFAHLTNHVFAVFRAGRPASPRLTVTMPLERLVCELNAYGPEAIATYPTILRMLSEEQLAGRLRITPRIVVTSSEVLGEDARRRAQEAWGVCVQNAYASTEGGMMATECSAHCGLHFWEDTLILEIVDERNRPVPAGTPGRKVLLTNLWNRVQPLIRYELADAVTLAAGHNPTGRPFARIANVEGRTADILWLPARTGGVVPVHPFILREPFTRMSDIRQYQFHPGRDRLEVSVVLAPNAAQDTLERVRATLTLALAEAGAAAQPVLLRQVDVIERVGSGAKLTLIGPSSLSSEVEALGQPTATRFADHRSPQASILSGDRPGIG